MKMPDEIQVPWDDIARRSKDGLSLIDAVLHYAPAPLKPALSRVRTLAWQIVESAEVSNLKRAVGREKKIGKAAAKRFADGRKAVRSADIAIRGALSKGALVGVGYFYPRTLLSDPVIIPPEAWGKAKYSWKQSKLSARDGEYVNIKIYRPEDCPNVKALWIRDPVTPQPEKKRRGAPGFERYSHEALDRIARTPTFRAAKSHKERADLIKAVVKIEDQAERDRYMVTNPKTLAGHIHSWRATQLRNQAGK